MKKFIYLVIASCLVALAVYALAIWVLGQNRSDALIMGVTTGLTGLFIEYFSQKFSKKNQPK